MERCGFVEGARSVAAVPHYLAVGLDLFAREGLEGRLATAGSEPRVARALQAGQAEIALAGPLRALAAADRGEARLTCVAEVSSRVAAFLLSRGPGEGFTWRDLVGGRVLVGVEDPTPRYGLEYLLERHGVGVGDVELVADVPSAVAAEALVAGRAEFLVLEPALTERLLASGQAHLAAALGPALGPLAAGAYLVTPRCLVERPDAIGAALRALCRAQRWLRAHPPEEVAAAVAWAFPDLERALLCAAIRRALAARTWAVDPVLRRPGFDALQEVLLLRGVVRRSHVYGELVDTALAEAAVRVVDASGGA